MSLLRFLVGKPLANREYGERKLGVFEGVPAMGLDGLASSAYGPEAALTVLIPLGAAGLIYIGPITLAILILLTVLYLSYRQTIYAYPSNGGAYVVASENLGTNAGLLAASALMVDYVLNVAVGISAGVGALVSALPTLHSHTLALCLAILALITGINLRGTLDAGRLFALPAYLFVASFLLLLALGLCKTIAMGGHPEPVMLPPALPETAAAASLWLLMRSFAGGCTAMTGVEAVSNGVSAFRDPTVKYARRTLTAICAILALLLGGIAYLVRAYGIGAMDQAQAGYQSILSQLAGAIVGHGPFYAIAIGSLLCVLCLSANTSFVGFPRLCRVVAQRGFLPRPFAIVGRRLVFSVGILYLATTAGLLLIVFGGITDRLIPLFAIGAFLTFTLSQSSMVVHWLRAVRQPATPQHQTKHRLRLAINAVGASVTGVALIVILAAKFTEGAWITVLVIPCTVVLLKMIKRYYDGLAARIRDDGPLDLRWTTPPVVLVATEGWNRLTDKAVGFSLRLSPDVIAVHLTQLEGPDVDEMEQNLRRDWRRDVELPVQAAGLVPPRLALIQSPYRRIHAPLLRFIESVEAEYPGRTVAVLIPELVTQHWWEYILHTHRARHLRSALLRYGGSRLVVINVPWYLEEPRIEDALEQEEKTETKKEAEETLTRVHP